MSATRDPHNPNSVNFGRPYFLPRPAMREQPQSQKIRAVQARLATVKPAKITLPPMPETLRND